MPLAGVGAEAMRACGRAGRGVIVKPMREALGRRIGITTQTDE